MAPPAQREAAHDRGEELKDPVLEVTGLTKSFPGVKALDDVNLTLNRGSVHGLVGENGAGKSTLIKIVTGVHTADAGSMRLRGEERSFATPNEATKAGIGVMHQERNIIPGFSVQENIDLVLPARRFGLIDRAERARRASRVLDLLGLDLPLTERVENLSVAQMQLIEIARALVSDTEVLLLDEPTASITGTEADRLFDVVRRLREHGTAIVFVSHKLEEVYELCDMVTVLRDGRSVVESDDLANHTTPELVQSMVGRELAAAEPRHREVDRGGTPVLELRNVATALGHRDVCLRLYLGEVLGLYGLVGAGRSELARSILGLHEITEGEICVDDVPVRIRNVATALHDHGIGYVTENRKEEGLFLDFSVRKNIAVTVWQRLASRFGVVSTSAEDETADKYVNKLEIKLTSTGQMTSTLSGGNQQKVSVAKWLAARTNILIIDEPTVGIDVGAKAAIHDLILELADEGLAILLISSDLPEIVALADRLIVMRELRLVAELENTKDYPDMSSQVMHSIQATAPESIDEAEEPTPS